MQLALARASRMYFQFLGLLGTSINSLLSISSNWPRSKCSLPRITERIKASSDAFSFLNRRLSQACVLRLSSFCILFMYTIIAKQHGESTLFINQQNQWLRLNI
jgi:hypothetical protein